MRAKQLDLLLAIAIALLNITWAWRAGRSPVIGLGLALPLVFVLPGYTLTEVLLYRRPPEAVRHSVFTLSLSMSIDIVSGLILNFFPVGLRVQSWAICLGTLTIVFSLLAAFLRRGRRKTSARKLWHWKGLFNLKRIMATLCLVAAIGVVLLALLISAYNAQYQRRPGFTQLWMLQADQGGNNCSVQIGVTSFELTRATYRLVMMINGSQANTWPSIILLPQKTWRTSVRVTAGASGNFNVEVRLYLADKPEVVYRNVHLTLYSQRENKDGRGRQCTT